MADTPETLENNWYKAIKGIKCTRLRIKSFVEENIKSFHQKVYATALQGLPGGSTCSACSTQNVLPCPTRNICDKKNNCSFHDKNDPGCQSKLCPKNICNKVRDEIINAHRHGAPSFRNTSATLWGSSFWQIAKCFLAATGYQDKMSADDTDFPGLISVILNHEDFQGLVSENLGQRNNLFEQARDARNTIMHSAGFELSSTDLKSHFVVFTKVLTYTKHIQGRPEAKNAVKTLQIILADQTIITEQEKSSLRKEALVAIKTVEDAKNEAIVGIELKENEILSTASTAERNITDAQNLASKEIERKQGEVLNSLELKLREANKTIKSSEEGAKEAFSRTMKENLDKLNSETAEHVQEIQRQKRESEVSVTGTKDKAITELEENSKLLMDKAKQDIQASMESSQDDFAKKTEDNLKKLKTNTEKYSAELEKQKQEMIGSVGKGITATKTGAIKELEDTKVALLEEAKLIIDKSKDGALEVIYNRTEELKTTVEEGNPQHKPSTDHDGVRESLELKKHLLEHYQRNGYTKLPLSPLVDDVEIDVDEVFVMPIMRVANYSQRKPETDLWSFSTQKDAIVSIKGIFVKNGKAINRACIGANGGYGKTTLCLMIISAWIKIHDDDTKSLNRCISKSDIEFLKSFDYLFYLPLRDLNGIVRVEEMIQLHLVKESLHAALAEVLRRESKKCLILLDGLDEWSGGQLPQIDRREHYSVLMTSRPYKIERVRPRVCDVEQEIEMIGLTDSNVIVIKLVAHLNRKYKKKNYKRCPCYSSYWNCNYNPDPRANTWPRFSDVPILLSYMVCLWFDERDCGNTRLGICFNMIDMMLEVAENKESIESRENESEDKKLILLPKGLGDLEYCKKYSNLLHSLSRLSFHTLMEKSPDDALIFPQTVCDMYGLTRIDIELCLKAALLSQSKFTGQATSKMKRLSFLHKTIQEVFAALYIANNGESSLRQFLQKYPSIEDLLEDSEMLAYVCGLRPDFIGQVSSHIARLADAHEAIQKYRRVFPSKDVPFLVRRIQHCVLDAIEEASLESHKIDFVELHDVYDEVFFWVERKYVPSGEILNNLTFYGMKSFRCGYLEDKVFCVGNQSSLPNLFLIDVEGVSDQQGIATLGNIIERASSLTRLKFSSFYEKTVNYSKLFTAITQRNLTFLEIADFHCNHHTKEELQSIVSRQTQLVTLCIAEVYCKTCRGRRCKFELDMAYHANLKYLVLNDVTLLPKQQLSCILEQITMVKCENVDSFLRTVEFSKYTTVLELHQGQNESFIYDFAPPPDEPVMKIKSITIDNRYIMDSYPSDNEDEDTSPGIEAESGTVPVQNKVSLTQSTHNIDHDFDDTAASISAEEWNATELSTETGEEFETDDNKSTNEQERGEGNEHLPELLQALSDAIPKLSRLEVLKVNNIDFGEKLFQLSDNMVSLQVVSLYNVSMTLECFEVFVESVAKFQQTVLASSENILVHPETHESQLLLSIVQKCNLVKVEMLRCEKPISGLKLVLFTSPRNISFEQVNAMISLANSRAREVFV